MKRNGNKKKKMKNKYAVDFNQKSARVHLNDLFLLSALGRAHQSEQSAYATRSQPHSSQRQHLQPQHIH